MADISMKDFLARYYRQLHFNEMPAPVMAQFTAYRNNNKDFRGHMKDWDSQLVDPATGHGFNLPDPNLAGGEFELSDDEWKNLYKAYRTALRGMDAARDDLNDKAKKFLDANFGSAKAFSSPTIDDHTAGVLDQLGQILGANPRFAHYLRTEYGFDDSGYSDLISGIKSRKYRNPKEGDLRKKIISIVRALADAQRAMNDGYDVGDFARLAPSLAGINLDALSDDLKRDDIDPGKLTYFKNNHQTLLNELYKNKDVFDAFRQYDEGKISKHIDRAREDVAYDKKDSKDYIPPKNDDTLTRWQQLNKWAGRTYDDVFDKYIKFHGDRLYAGGHVTKEIVDALNGAKVKPTDGLKAVLENADKIKQTLQYKSPRATDAFEWMAKTLGPLQKSKEFAGALKNARQMKGLVSKIIMAAVRDNKMDQAKIALEVLSVIKYGYTTSNIMKALGKESVSIFSDPKLSWNKYEGTRFVTGALDKSIKWAFKSIGWGVTIVGNAIRLNGSKFNGRLGGTKRKKSALWRAQEKWAKENAEDYMETKRLARINNAADDATRTNAQSVLAGLDSGPNPINAGNIAAQQARLDADRALIETTNAALKARADGVVGTAQNLIGQVDGIHSNLQTLTTEIRDLNQQIRDLTNNISALNTQFNNPATYAGMPPPAANALAAKIQAQIDAAQQKLADTRAQLQQKRDAARTAVGEYRTATGQTAWNIAGNHGTRYTNAQNTVSQYNTDYANHQLFISNTDDLDARVSKFKDGTSTINEMTENINRRNNELSNWGKNHQDSYRELMAYWDMLESGRDSHTGKMYGWVGSKKKRQKKFETNFPGMFNQYLAEYNYRRS